MLWHLSYISENINVYKEENWKKNQNYIIYSLCWGFLTTAVCQTLVPFIALSTSHYVLPPPTT